MKVILNVILTQFECLNTLSEQLLESVRVQLEPSEGYQLVKEVPCSRMWYNEKGNVYIVLKFPSQLSASIGIVVHSVALLNVLPT